MARLLGTDRSGLCMAVFGMVAVILAGCGGGTTGGGGTNPPPSTGDFAISATPLISTLGVGGSETVTVSVAEVNTYTSSVSVSVSGLPSGVTASPATFTLSPGNQQTVELKAAATATGGTATITFQGTSGSLSHGASATLNLILEVLSSQSPLRTQYIRTNSFYDPNSLQLSPPHFTAYDAAHKQFFVSNPYLNEIDVFSSATETQTGTISVPMAWGIDVSPNNGSLYAGTLLGDVYQINTSTLAVTTRFPAASIGPTGFGAQTTLVLADGRLALQGGAGGILGVDGFGSVAVWNPATNALDTGTSGSVCNVGNEGTIALSGDRTRILVTWVDEGGSAPVCSYDPVAQVAAYGSLPTPNGSPVRGIIPTPDGSRFFLITNLQGVAVFDARTAQLLAQIGGGQNSYLQLPSGASSGVVSLDGKTLYLDGFQVAAYDTTSFAQTGWVSQFSVDDSQSTMILGAIDETGLIVGPIGHGVAFIDGTTLKSVAPTLLAAEIGSTPATGPLSGGTALTNFLVGNSPTPGVALTQMYAGNIPGVDASFAVATGQNAPSAQMSTPPSGLSGAVNLSVQLSDGSEGVAPEAFSYGPTILEVVPNGATAEGGQTGAIIGYGFGSSLSAVQVMIGGQTAPVTAVRPYAPIEPYPFPTNALQFTIPAAAAGTVADVTVTTPSGSFTAKGAFHYTAATTSYPVTATLQAGLYDAGRNLYFFTDQKQIQVFSPATAAWLAPIPLPHVTSSTQLLAIAESPDGTKLAVSDYGGQAIYVLDPDNPASATAYPMSLDKDGFSSSLAPDGLAVTNAGNVYFDTNDINGTGTPAIHKLNTSAGTITDLRYASGVFNYGPVSGGTADKFDRVILSPDGTNIYTNVEGSSNVINPATDEMTGSAATSSADGGVPDLAVSGDSSTVLINGILADESLQPENEAAYVDWETWFPTSVVGQKLNQDGSILFQPLTDGVDLIARNSGRLLYRIQIPETAANVYDPLLIAKGQNSVAVITSTGVSFIDLSSLPIGAKDSQPFADATRSTATNTSGSSIFLEKQTGTTKLFHSNGRPGLKVRSDSSAAVVQTNTLPTPIK